MVATRHSMRGLGRGQAERLVHLGPVCRPGEYKVAFLLFTPACQIRISLLA